MPLTLAAVALAASTALATDTTISVRPDTRLYVRNFSGEVRVAAWDRRMVRIVAEHAEGDRVRIVSRPGRLYVESRPVGGPPGRVSLRLLVPRGMPLSVNGTFAMTDVRGMRGDVSVQTVSGPVAVEGGSGFLSLSSIQGPISVRDAHGRLFVNSVNGEIRVLGIDGPIQAETINGPIRLGHVVSDSVDASTVNGSLCYEGTIRAGGWYRFSSHNGDVAVGLPDGTGAMVTLATYKGRIRSDFPLPPHSPARVGRNYQFRLGSGEAVLEMESFKGLVRLLRPGPAWVVGEPPCREPRAEGEEGDEP